MWRGDLVRLYGLSVCKVFVENLSGVLIQTGLGYRWGVYLSVLLWCSIYKYRFDCT